MKMFRDILTCRSVLTCGTSGELCVNATLALYFYRFRLAARSNDLWPYWRFYFCVHLLLGAFSILGLLGVYLRKPTVVKLYYFATLLSLLIACVSLVPLWLTTCQCEGLGHLWPYTHKPGYEHHQCSVVLSFARSELDNPWPEPKAVQPTHAPEGREFTRRMAVDNYIALASKGRSARSFDQLRSERCKCRENQGTCLASYSNTLERLVYWCEVGPAPPCFDTNWSMSTCEVDERRGNQECIGHCCCSGKGLDPIFEGADFAKRDASAGKYCSKWSDADERPWCYVGIDTTCPERTLVWERGGLGIYIYDLQQYASYVPCQRNAISRAAKRCIWITGTCCALAIIVQLSRLAATSVLRGYLRNACMDVPETDHQFEVEFLSDDAESQSQSGQSDASDGAPKRGRIKSFRRQGFWRGRGRGQRSTAPSRPDNHQPNEQGIELAERPA